jgi:hypothetical protein
MEGFLDQAMKALGSHLTTGVDRDCFLGCLSMASSQ